MFVSVAPPTGLVIVAVKLTIDDDVAVPTPLKGIGAKLSAVKVMTGCTGGGTAVAVALGVNVVVALGTVVGDGPVVALGATVGDGPRVGTGVGV